MSLSQLSAWQNQFSRTPSITLHDYRNALEAKQVITPDDVVIIQLINQELNWRAHGKVEPTNPFQGEQMHCIMCDRVEDSDPLTASNWRFLHYEGKSGFVCPDHFPDDTAAPSEFQTAYLKALKVLMARFPDDEPNR